jgi:hypothetical protein
VQTDTAKQPKIIEGGSLVSGGLDFDGVDDYFLSSHILSSDDVLSLYAVGAFDDLTQQGTMVRDLFYVNNSNNGGFSLENNTFTLSGRIAGYGDDALVTHNAASFITEGSESLFEMQLAAGSSSFYVNGSSVDTISATMNSEDGGSVLAIGASATGTNPFIGQITEIIIYNSDQSTKRRAIEENIANHYDISLAAFSRDGTVSTWYDQSGNTPANHATQTDPTKQPKIVNAGSLVSGGLDFDGVDDYLVTTQGYIVELSQNPASVFCVATPDNTNQGYLLTEGDRISPYSSQFILNGASNGSVTVWVNTVEFGSGFPASKTLGGFIYNGTTFQAYLNGSADGSAGTADINAEVFNQTFIGTRADGTTFFFAGKVEELITYKSDQSANRVAIETNINNQYDIY